MGQQSWEFLFVLTPVASDSATWFRTCRRLILSACLGVLRIVWWNGLTIFTSISSARQWTLVTVQSLWRNHWQITSTQLEGFGRSFSPAGVTRTPAWHKRNTL